MRNRDAEALERLLEGGPTPLGDGPAELRSLAAVAEALSAPITTPAPDEAFRTELRAMLLEEARGLQAQALPRILPRVRAASATLAERWRYSTRVAAASLAAALTFSGGGAVAVAAERALPSDALYGVKLVLDEARAGVRFDTVARGEIHLGNATERIDEAELSAALGDQPGAARALNESADSARKGARELIRGYEQRRDAAIVATLSAFADTQADRVRVLAERLTGDARDAARSSLVVLERIEARLVAIGGVCGNCPAEAPQSGSGFDFSEIPPAGEPFQPCPCDDGSGDPVASDPREPGQDPGAAGGPGEQPTEQPSPPDDDDGDDGDGDVVPGLPEPAGETVNEVLKEITKTAEKALEAMPAPQSGGLAVPTAAPGL